MKIETKIAIDNLITSPETFTRLFEEKRDATNIWSPPKYRIVAIPTMVLEDLKEALGYIADDMSEEDFNEDGTVKQISEDETVSDFLKRFIEVQRVPSRYKVVVEFEVEAEDEDEAREEVENYIDGRAEYEVSEVTEQD